MLLRHRRIRNFKIGKFQFKNHLLKIRSEEEEKEFSELIAKAPRLTQNSIVEINEEAMSSLEKPFQPAVRGAQPTSEITAGKTNPGDGTQQPNLDPASDPKPQSQQGAVKTQAGLSGLGNLKQQ